MSSVRSDYQGEAKITYLTTRVFNDDFFTYTLAFNNSTSRYEGTLSVVSGASAGNCPIGRFLHESGKVLIPGANSGIRTPMVGVYDPVSCLKGFIDPNCEVFARMNNNRAANLDALTVAGKPQDFNGVFGVDPNPDPFESDLGQPVLTHGDIVSDAGNVSATGAGCLPAGPSAICGHITARNNITATSGNIAASGVGEAVGPSSTRGNITAQNNITATSGNIAASAGSVTAQTNVTAVTGNVTAAAGNVIADKKLIATNLVGIKLVISGTTGVGTYNIDSSVYSLGRIYFADIVPPGGGTVSITDTSATMPQKGATMRYRVSTDDTSSYNLTFNSARHYTTSYIVSNTGVVASLMFEFVSDGTKYELISVTSGANIN